MTKNLKFLMLHFYKSEALQEHQVSDEDTVYKTRLEVLREAKKEIDIFLHMNEKIGMLLCLL